MPLKLCTDCHSVLKSSTLTGELVYHCRCSKVIPSTPEDTLLSEKYIEVSKSNQKYEVFIEDSPFDTAGKKVMRDCTQCGINFMTQIYVGTSQTIMYTCTCGNRMTNDNIKEATRKKHTALEKK